MSTHKKQAKIIHFFRRTHRQIAIILFAFFMIVAITGLLLGWKKNSFGIILPKVNSGKSSDLKTWIPFDSLHTIAIKTLHDSISPDLAVDLERIDVRPQKGIVKFVFADDYWEVQLDGSTGSVLSVNRRNSDIIENIHDGTIIDVIFNTKNGEFKLIYVTILSITLLFLCVSGFWLWYGPKKLKQKSS